MTITTKPSSSTGVTTPAILASGVPAKTPKRFGKWLIVAGAVAASSALALIARNYFSRPSLVMGVLPAKHFASNFRVESNYTTLQSIVSSEKEIPIFKRNRCSNLTVEKDQKIADLLKKSCASNSIYDWYWVGTAYYDQAKYSEAVNYFRIGAEQGNAAFMGMIELLKHKIPISVFTQIRANYDQAVAPKKS